MDGFALGVEGGAVEDFVEGLLGLADNLYAALLGVPAFTHHVDVHDAAWARDLEFLMLVHAGLHLDGVGLLRAVAVLGGGAFQNGGRQVALVIAVVFGGVGGCAVFVVQTWDDGIDIRGIVDELDALFPHRAISAIDLHRHHHHGCCAVRGLAEELGVEGLKLVFSCYPRVMLSTAMDSWRKIWACSLNLSGFSVVR